MTVRGAAPKVIVPVKAIVVDKQGRILDLPGIDAKAYRKNNEAIGLGS